MVLNGGVMKTKLRFEDLTWPARTVLLAGLTLASASFWVPRESAIHAAGGSTIGIVFVFFALSSVCNWFLAVCSVAATAFFLIGGFGYSSLKDGGKVFLLTGAAFTLAAVLSFVAEKLRSFKQRSLTKA